MNLLLVDSYDSFTHNLAQAFEVVGCRVQIVQSDRITASEILELAPDHVVLGPGPGRPEEAGCLVDAVGVVGGRIPLLGVCLGHQAIGLAFGGRVVRHDVVHGHAHAVQHQGEGLFAGLPDGVELTRYHSLVVDDPVPDELVVTARAPDGAVMALRHRSLPIFGVQFHPESVLSGAPGLQLLTNFLAVEVGARVATA